MSGFYGFYKLDRKSENLVDVQEESSLLFHGDNFFIARQKTGKFSDDEIFHFDEDVVVCLTGVVLNQSELLKENKEQKFSNLIIGLFKRDGISFCKRLRGSFSGVVYDRSNRHLVLFTNHFGDKQVFYSIRAGHLFFGSKVSDLTGLFKKNNLTYGIDEKGIGSMLSYGFMVENYTLVEGVKKLPFGTVVDVVENQPTVQRYWDFNNTEYTKESPKDILEHVDHLFRKAVEREFQKDTDYDFPHFVTLSAGLDSRMVAFVAHDLGFTRQTNFTYSRHLYADQTVAQQMAEDLGHSFVFSLLNEKNFFEQYNELIQITCGNCTLAGNISGFNSIRNINFDPFGLVHTGQLGDVVLGSYNKTKQHLPPNRYSGAFSSNRFGFAPEIDLKNYPNNEYFMLTQRGFNGILQGNLMYQEHSEVISPFLDVDFFEYCMSIPSELRFNHTLYIEWIRQFHPRAAAYLWDKTMATLDGPFIRYKNTIFPLSNLLHPRRALLPRIGKISKTFNFLAKKNSMTPMQYWFENNPTLQEKIKHDIRSSGFSDQLSPEIRQAFEKILMEKEINACSQLLTVTEALKLLIK